MLVYPYVINGGVRDLPSRAKKVIKKGRTLFAPF